LRLLRKIYSLNNKLGKAKKPRSTCSCLGCCCEHRDNHGYSCVRRYSMFHLFICWPWQPAITATKW